MRSDLGPSLSRALCPSTSINSMRSALRISVVKLEAMSSEAALDEVARLQPPTEAERERGEEALGPLEGRIDEH